MDKEKHQYGKDVLMGEYRKWSAFSGYHNFAPAGLIERYMKGAIFRFHETKKDDRYKFVWKHYQYTSI